MSTLSTHALRQVPIAAVVLGATLAVVEQPAFAQINTATESQPVGLEEVIVTAQRVESNLQRTPIAVTSLTAQALDEKGINSLIDVGNYTPSLATGGRGGEGAAEGSISLRGIGTDAPDSAPSVGLYIDDVYYPSAFGNVLGIFDVQRVEVLRGPQGTLFGRNTIAGAIQYVSVQPKTDELEGFVEALGGTENSYGYDGAVNIPVSSTLAFRISAKEFLDGGYVHDRLNDVNRGQERSDQGRIQMLWTPTDKLSVHLKAEAATSNTNGRPTTIGAVNFTNAASFDSAFGIGPGALPPFLQSPDKTLPTVDTNRYSTAGDNAPDFFRIQFETVNGTVAYDLTDSVTLKSISSYSFTKSNLQVDFDGTPAAILTSDRGIDIINLYTQEFQFNGRHFDDRVHWTAGAYYYNSDENIADVGGGPGLIPVTAPFDAPSATTDAITISVAGYAQGTVEIVDGVSASIGGRYSTETVRGRFPQTDTPEVQPHTFDNTSPYAGLDWQIDPDTLLYAKASRGFRAGGVHLDAGYTYNPTSLGALYFGPETAWTYEIGGRFTLLDNRLKVNPTVYVTDWSNIQFNDISIVDDRPIAGTRNAGDARLKGFELESQYALTQALELTATYSYLEAHYTSLDPSLLSFIPGSNTVPVILNVDDPLARAPKTKFSLGGHYTWHLPNDSTLVFSSDYAWTDKQSSTVDQSQAVTLPEYGLLSARLDYQTSIKGLEFAVTGTNLTGRYYLIDGLNFQATTGTETLIVGRPRQVIGSVKYSF